MSVNFRKDVFWTGRIPTGQSRVLFNSGQGPLFRSYALSTIWRACIIWMSFHVHVHVLGLMPCPTPQPHHKLPRIHGQLVIQLEVPFWLSSCPYIWMLVNGRSSFRIAWSCCVCIWTVVKYSYRRLHYLSDVPDSHQRVSSKSSALMWAS